FAGITCALIVGSLAERVKFTAALLFSVIWFSLCYLPIAHMVWGEGGYLLDKGALDFAGGTVVHINAGVAGLVGAWLLGKRLGYGREAMPPHNLPLTLVGAALLWVGWFGFNAGSNLEATSGAALAFINTLVATAAAVLSWSAVEGMIRGKASMLGAASGAVAGLVAITPACGSVGVMGALVIGLVAGAVCLWGVTSLKRLLGADDSLDVFGVHGVGGIVGALLTGVFTAPGLGGTGGDDFSIVGQVLLQAEGVAITIVWSGVVALIAFKVVDVLVGLRVDEEAEREGLDISSHGEKAYEI
ncbi:MAG: ammonia channel protein, partial [Gammaproteobacteria bacterium HGW-Gammaproteobacteria-7]